MDDLMAKAKAASTNAYAPYSRFPVGAAVRCSDGSIFSGCNVENASFGLTICAERVAVFNAVSAGHRDIVELALYTPTESYTTPCGACRQVLREFGKQIVVTCGSEGEEVFTSTLDELLPESFGPESL